MNCWNNGVIGCLKPIFFGERHHPSPFLQNPQVKMLTAAPATLPSQKARLLQTVRHWQRVTKKAAKARDKIALWKTQPLITGLPPRLKPDKALGSLPLDLRECYTIWSYQDFLEELLNSWRLAAKAIGNEEFSLHYSCQDQQKSEHWISGLLFQHCLDFTPTGMTTTRKNVVIVDDAAYTGSQLHEYLHNFIAQNKGKVVHLVLPFCSNLAKKKIMSLAVRSPVDIIIYSTKTIFSLAEIFKKKGREHSLPSNLNPMCYTALFDHKIADNLSIGKVNTENFHPIYKLDSALTYKNFRMLRSTPRELRKIAPLLIKNNFSYKESNFLAKLLNSEQLSWLKYLLQQGVSKTTAVLTAKNSDFDDLKNRISQLKNAGLPEFCAVKYALKPNDFFKKILKCLSLKFSHASTIMMASSMDFDHVLERALLLAELGFSLENAATLGCSQHSTDIARKVLKELEISHRSAYDLSLSGSLEKINITKEALIQGFSEKDALEISRTGKAIYIDRWARCRNIGISESLSRTLIMDAKYDMLNTRIESLLGHNIAPDDCYRIANFIDEREYKRVSNAVIIACKAGFQSRDATRIGKHVRCNDCWIEIREAYFKNFSISQIIRFLQHPNAKSLLKIAIEKPNGEVEV